MMMMVMMIPAIFAISLVHPGAVDDDDDDDDSAECDLSAQFTSPCISTNTYTLVKYTRSCEQQHDVGVYVHVCASGWCVCVCVPIHQTCWLHSASRSAHHYRCQSTLKLCLPFAMLIYVCVSVCTTQTHVQSSRRPQQQWWTTTQKEEIRKKARQGNDSFASATQSCYITRIHVFSCIPSVQRQLSA